MASCVAALLLPPYVSSPAQAPQADEDAAVVDAVRTMYRAATKDDLDLFHSVVSARFHAFDGGKRFDGDALPLLIRQAHEAGVVYVWQVTEPEVHRTSNTAWIAYTNVGSRTGKDGQTVPMKWLESAQLEKQGGKWLIVFFHSTRMPM
ncbi:nuclear transport factor 2 family protein [Terriglobus sp. 2YAB30_2]|uniref:nuclear transport factor 2 family protein n=1 Tax=unclassified Terriglobus TaxID=2628988 RepID=UPI003F9C7D01